MKKILIQLDTDEHPSTFDAIVAHDADVDVLLSYGGVEPDVVRGPRAVGVLHPRPQGPGQRWRSGSAARAWARARRCWPRSRRRSSARSACRRCSTPTAATRPRRRRSRGSPREIDLKGRRVVIVGAGAVGLRAAELLIDEGCEVTVSGIPASRFGDKPYRRARGLDVAEKRDMKIVEPDDDEELAKRPRRRLARARRRSRGRRAAARVDLAQIDSIEVLADFNAAEPLGIEGTDAQDELEDYDGKRVLGALAIGGPKMKVHKACVRRLFESNDAILDVDGVYEIAKELADLSRAVRASPGSIPAPSPSRSARSTAGCRCWRRASPPRSSAPTRRRWSTRCAPTRPSISCSVPPATGSRSSRPRRSASASSR